MTPKEALAEIYKRYKMNEEDKARIKKIASLITEEVESLIEKRLEQLTREEEEEDITEFDKEEEDDDEE